MSISDWSSDVCSSDLKRVAIRRCDQAIGIHRPDQTPVDRRHPLLANVVAQPRLDFLVGARPEIERHELGRALADSVGYIFAGDDQILARVIDAAQHRSEEHTSELQSLMRISYAVFCLKKKIQHHKQQTS